MTDFLGAFRQGDELAPEETARFAEDYISYGRGCMDPLPRYGGSHWLRLRWDNPAKWAALFVAAEAWRRHTSVEVVAEDMRLELRQDEHMLMSSIRGTSADVREATDWEAVANRPTHAELQRRRGVA